MQHDVNWHAVARQTLDTILLARFLRVCQRSLASVFISARPTHPPAHQTCSGPASADRDLERWALIGKLASHDANSANCIVNVARPGFSFTCQFYVQVRQLWTAPSFLQEKTGSTEVFVREDQHGGHHQSHSCSRVLA